MTTQEHMGFRIKYLREQAKMSQTTLAEKVGYKDKTAIAKIEAGKVDLPQSKIIAFTKALNTSTAYLFGDTTLQTAPVPTISLKTKTENKQEQNLLSHFNKLNDAGKTEATKRVEELTYFPRYAATVMKQNSEAVLLNAAHERTDIEVTDEMKKQDNDIMDDPDF